MELQPTPRLQRALQRIHTLQAQRHQLHEQDQDTTATTSAERSTTETNRNNNNHPPPQSVLNNDTNERVAKLLQSLAASRARVTPLYTPSQSLPAAAASSSSAGITTDGVGNVLTRPIMVRNDGSLMGPSYSSCGDCWLHLRVHVPHLLNYPRLFRTVEEAQMTLRIRQQDFRQAVVVASRAGSLPSGSGDDETPASSWWFNRTTDGSCAAPLSCGSLDSSSTTLQSWSEQRLSEIFFGEIWNPDSTQQQQQQQQPLLSPPSSKMDNDNDNDNPSETKKKGLLLTRNAVTTLHWLVGEALKAVRDDLLLPKLFSESPSSHDDTTNEFEEMGHETFGSQKTLFLQNTAAVSVMHGSFGPLLASSPLLTASGGGVGGGTGRFLSEQEPSTQASTTTTTTTTGAADGRTPTITTRTSKPLNNVVANKYLLALPLWQQPSSTSPANTTQPNHNNNNSINNASLAPKYCVELRYAPTDCALGTQPHISVLRPTSNNINNDDSLSSTTFLSSPSASPIVPIPAALLRSPSSSTLHQKLPQHSAVSPTKTDSVTVVDLFLFAKHDINVQYVR